MQIPRAGPCLGILVRRGNPELAVGADGRKLKIDYEHEPVTTWPRVARRRTVGDVYKVRGRTRDLWKGCPEAWLDDGGQAGRLDICHAWLTSYKNYCFGQAIDFRFPIRRRHNNTWTRLEEFRFFAIPKMAERWSRPELNSSKRRPSPHLAFSCLSH